MFSFLVISATIVASLAGAEVYPESITYDSRSSTFYVSGNGDGSVQAMQGGVATMLQAPGTDGRSAGLGIKVDEARDRLWVLDAESAYVYSLSTNALVKKIPAPAPGLNDLAIGADGTAYLTNSFSPELLKVDGESLTMSVFRDLSAKIPYGLQNGVRYNLNGIVLTPGGTAVLAVKTNDGTLWRISLVDDDVHEVALNEPVTKGDGLVWGSDGQLFIVRNYENKISRVDMANGADAVARTVATASPSGLEVPTSAVFLSTPTPHLVLVNSQFDQALPQLPFTVVAVDLARSLFFP